MSFNIISIQNNPLKRLLASFVITTLTLGPCNVSALLLMKNYTLNYFCISFLLSKFCSTDTKSTSTIQVPTVQFSALKNYIITV